MKTKKIIKILLILIIITSAAVLTVNAVVVGSTKDRILSLEEIDFSDADCILILGAGLRNDNSPSHMLEDRLKTGIEVYEKGASPVLLMSGDHGREEYNEVGAMKSFAIEKGVPSDKIFMDHAGFSTYDSIYRAKHIFGAKKIVIITQKYHLYRALYLADSIGIDAVGVSADKRTYVMQIKRDIREIIARVKDFATAQIKPLPKYLGDEISLEASGDITND